MNDKSNVIQGPTSTSNEPAIGTTVGVSRRSFVGSATLAGMALAAGSGTSSASDVQKEAPGDEALNVKLSQQRAEAVREALIKYGADPDMLIAKGYGEADPVASNETAEGRLKNRRIEYHVVKAPT